MNIYDLIAVATFVIGAIIMNSQHIDNEVPRVSDILQIMNILACYELKAYKGSKQLKNQELVKYINSPVKAYELKDGILYIEIW